MGGPGQLLRDTMRVMGAGCCTQFIANQAVDVMIALPPSTGFTAPRACLIAALIDPESPHPILSLFGERAQANPQVLATRLTNRPVTRAAAETATRPRRMGNRSPRLMGSRARQPLHGADCLSDSLCRAATGDGDVGRALYTDSDLAVFAFRRCIILNGIDVGALRGDLADRTLPINL